MECASGCRGDNAIENAIVGLGLVKTGAAVGIPFGMRSVADGVFVADGKQAAILGGILAELSTLAEALRPMR